MSGATTLMLNGFGTGGVTLGGAISNGGGTLGLVLSQAGTTQLTGNLTYSGTTHGQFRCRSPFRFEYSYKRPDDRQLHVDDCRPDHDHAGQRRRDNVLGVGNNFGDNSVLNVRPAQPSSPAIPPAGTSAWAWAPVPMGP